MGFCHLQENLLINITESYCILQQKQEKMLQKLLQKE